MEPVDVSKKHAIVSFIKSGIRMIGCVGAFLALNNGSVEDAVVALATTFLVAEILGVLEEL